MGRRYGSGCVSFSSHLLYHVTVLTVYLSAKSSVKPKTVETVSVASGSSITTLKRGENER